MSSIIESSRAHPTHVSALSSRTTRGSYPGGYPTPPHGGRGHRCRSSRCLSDIPALACCVILPPLRTSALLTVGLPGHIPLDLNGITAFRRYETRSGWASPLSRGGGVLPTSRTSPVGACRFPAASPSPSLPQPVREGSSDETSTEIHTINPSDLSLARSPRTERGHPSAFPPGFAPRRYQRRTPRWEQVSRTLTQSYTFDTVEPPNGKPTHYLRPRVALSSVPRERRCSRDRSVVLSRRLPPLNGVVPATLVFLPAPRFDNDEVSARIHGYSPVQPSPRL